MQAGSTLPSRHSRPNGHAHRGGGFPNQSTRSQSSMSHAPPVPPRSMLSMEATNGMTARNVNYPGVRSATLHHPKQHSQPARSSSVIDHAPSYHGNGHYGYESASQVETSSSTVFIHHLNKDRPRLAHMV